MVNSNGNQGVAYIFVESGGTWSQNEVLASSDAIAVNGDTIVAGVPNQTVGSNLGQGAAYVFVKSGSTWTQQAELTAGDGESNEFFGSSVAVDNGTAVVSAGGHTIGANGHQGTAYVFVQNGTTWSQQAELTASDGVIGDWFGQSVAVSGSTIVAGAPNHTVGENGGQGTAYVFGSSGPLYTLSAVPSSLSVAQGGQQTSTVTITPWNGFSGSVSLSASGLPSGVTAAFSPNPATSASTLTLAASGTATMGAATVILTGTSGNLAQTTRLPLTVTQGPTATLTPASLSFGNEAVNNTSAAKTVTVKNTGTASLKISSITASNNFGISSTTCGAMLNAGTTCKVNVTFTPAEVSSLTGTLAFSDNAQNSPQTARLTGKGVVDATLTPASASYGKQSVGITSAAKTFTLTNNQLVALTGAAISTSGDFAVSATTCGTSLAAKSKCTISVTFTPTATGTQSGQLIVNDSGSNSPQTATLAGTGK
jgi:hypothetical protein